MYAISLINQLMRFAGLNNGFLAASLPFKPCSISRLLMVILETFSDSDLEAFISA